MSLFIVNIFFFSTLNALIYLHSIYPSQDTISSISFTLTKLWIIWEGIAAMIASHTWCLLIKYIITAIDDVASLQANHKKCYTYFVNMMEIFMVISAIFFHICAVIEHDVLTWIYWYYITVGIQIMCLAVFMLIMFRRALQILGQNEQSTASAIKDIHAAQFVTYIIIFAAIIDILSSLQAVYDMFKFQDSYNQELITDILFCITLFFLSTSLTLWICKKPENCRWSCGNHCCKVCRKQQVQNSTVHLLQNQDESTQPHLNESEGVPGMKSRVTTFIQPSRYGDYDEYVNRSGILHQVLEDEHSISIGIKHESQIISDSIYGDVHATPVRDPELSVFTHSVQGNIRITSFE